MPKVTEEHKRQRRLEIITAAKTVFREKGYLKASMQDIIDEVGLSRGAVYDYFDNKAHVFQAVIDNQDEQLWQLQRETCAARPIWPAFQQLILDPFERYDEDSPKEIGAHIEFVLQSRNDGEGRAWVANRYQKFVHLFTQILETGVEIGEFQPVLPVDVIVRFMLSAIDGMHLGVLAIVETNISSQSQALKRFLVDSLKPNKEESI